MRKVGTAILALAVSTAWLVGCFPTSLCGTNRTPVTEDGGQPVACVVAETCPRPENVPLCLSNATPESSCVLCQAQVCTQVTPLRCD